MRLGLVWGAEKKGMGLGHEASASPPRMYGEEGRWVTGIHGTSFRYAGPGGTVVRTHHSQALQLPQTQEGAGLHRADDVVSQVPAEDKRRALTPRPLGGTRPTWVGSSCPSRGWVSVALEIPGVLSGGQEAA